METLPFEIQKIESHEIFLEGIEAFDSDNHCERTRMEVIQLANNDMNLIRRCLRYLTNTWALVEKSYQLLASTKSIKAIRLKYIKQSFMKFTNALEDMICCYHDGFFYAAASLFNKDKTIDEQISSMLDALIELHKSSEDIPLDKFEYYIKSVLDCIYSNFLSMTTDPDWLKLEDHESISDYFQEIQLHLLNLLEDNIELICEFADGEISEEEMLFEESMIDEFEKEELMEKDISSEHSDENIIIDNKEEKDSSFECENNCKFCPNKISDDKDIDHE